MKYIILLITINLVQLIINYNGIQASNAQCRSYADPNLITFDGLYYQFHRTGDHYILYDNSKDTRVTVGYQSCGASATCNCAVYLKKGRKLVFLDFCTATSSSSPTSRFYGVSVDSNNVGISPIKLMPRCPIILVNQENDEKVWNNITTFLGNFKCARLQGSNYYDTYVIRTVENRFEETVKVRVQLSNRNMPDLRVQASKSSFKNSGGLCGMWDGNAQSNRELYVLDKNGVVEYLPNLNSNNLDNLAEFWKLHSRYNKDHEVSDKRCPECFLMSERSFYCPCDDFDLFDINNYNIEYPNRTTYCKIPMSQCVEKVFNFNDPILSTNETDNSTSINETISFEQALSLCKESFMSNQAISQIVTLGLFESNFTTEVCANDIINSGNVSVIELHVQIFIDLIIEIILTNPSNFINESWLNDVLIDLCPNKCNGEGICNLDTNCINSTTEQCLSPIKCICNEPFGGKDCGIDLTDIAELSLDRKCCDLRKENCSIINGFGYEFSTRDTIYVKIELIEYSNNKSIVINEYQTINSLSDNQLTFKINKLNQLNLYKNIHELWNHKYDLDSSEAYVSIYISYTNSSFVEQASFTLYDSKCRSCSEELTTLNEFVCEINGVCYSDHETLSTDSQFICVPENSNSSWTYRPTPDPLCSGNYEWTEWYNTDIPDGDGDLELIKIFKLGCGQKSKLTQVVTVDGLIPFNQTGQVVHFSPSCYGFMCLNRLQPNGTQCLDYQIRQCCPAGSINASTIATSTQSTTTKSTTTTTTLPPKRNQLKFTFNSNNGGHKPNELVYTMLSVGNGILATGSLDFNVKVWDTKKGKLIYSFDHKNNGHDGYVYSLANFKNKSYLASGSEDSSIKIYNLNDGKLVFNFDEFYGGHISYVYALTTLTNDYLASGSEDAKIKIWEVNNGSLVHIFDGGSYVLALESLPNGYLASGSHDYNVRIWDTEKKILVHKLEGHTDDVVVLKFLSNSLLASGSKDSIINIWNYENGTLENSLSGHQKPITSLVLLSNGYLASSSDDGTIKVWDFINGTLILSLDVSNGGHNESVKSITQLTNGYLASGSADLTIKLWDIDSGILKHTFNRTNGGHSNIVFKLVALPDNELASGSADGTVKIWEIEDRSNI